MECISQICRSRSIYHFIAYLMIDKEKIEIEPEPRIPMGSGEFVEVAVLDFEDSTLTSIEEDLIA